MPVPTTTATPTATVTLRRSARLIEQSKNAPVKNAGSLVNNGVHDAEPVQKNVPVTDAKPVQRSGIEDRVDRSAGPDIASLKIRLPARPPPKIKISAEKVVEYLATLKRKAADEDSEGEGEEDSQHSEILPATKKQRTTEDPKDSLHCDEVEGSGDETNFEAAAKEFLSCLFEDLLATKPSNGDGPSALEGNTSQSAKISMKKNHLDKENAEEVKDVLERNSSAEKISTSSSKAPTVDIAVTTAVVLNDAQSKITNMASPSIGSSNDGLIAAGESISALRSTLRTNETGQAAVPDSEDESEDE